MPTTISGTTITTTKLISTQLTGSAITTTQLISTQLTGSLVYSSGLLTGSSLTVTNEITAASMNIAGGSQRPVTATTGTAPYYGARAWVNFNGIGTIAIRASGNVSSITDNGVGDYTVNFTTALADENYVVLGTTVHGAALNDVGVIGVRGTGSGATLKSTTQVRLDNTYASNTGAGYYDAVDISVTIFR